MLKTHRREKLFSSSVPFLSCFWKNEVQLLHFWKKLQHTVTEGEFCSASPTFSIHCKQHIQNCHFLNFLGGHYLHSSKNKIRLRNAELFLNFSQHNSANFIALLFSSATICCCLCKQYWKSFNLHFKNLRIVKK